MEEVRDWQSRPLDTVYPVIFLDALVCKVRENGTVRRRPLTLPSGVNTDGKKEVLGIWVEASGRREVLDPRDGRAQGPAASRTCSSWSATA
jgi:transposase-like protein